MMKIFSEKLIRAVIGAVVHDHHEVVGIVLPENRVEVVLEPKTGIVVIARHHNTHRDLFGYRL